MKFKVGDIVTSKTYNNVVAKVTKYYHDSYGNSTIDVKIIKNNSNFWGNSMTFFSDTFVLVSPLQAVLHYEV